MQSQIQRMLCYLYWYNSFLYIDIIAMKQHVSCVVNDDLSNVETISRIELIMSEVTNITRHLLTQCCILTRCVVLVHVYVA